MGIFLLPNLAYLSDITAENIINLTNQERQAAGLNTLTSNQLLTQAATAKGQAILESQNFSHNIDNKKFSSWIRDVGYNYSYVGENLAIDFTASEEIMKAWENSPLHKKNLLSPYYQEIGVATVDGKFQGQDTTIVVQIFGAPTFSSFQPSTINSNLNYSNLNLVSNQFNSAKNLLNYSIINKELLANYNNKIILPSKNNLITEANNFIVQPEFNVIDSGLTIILSFLVLIYLFTFLSCYKFFKINKLASI
ncbi:MAG: CAP domain-containing protein [Patescibacteria group bacterium]|jgi:hypothetical protein